MSKEEILELLIEAKSVIEAKPSSLNPNFESAFQHASRSLTIKFNVPLQHDTTINKYVLPEVYKTDTERHKYFKPDEMMAYSTCALPTITRLGIIEKTIARLKTEIEQENA